MHSRLLSDFKHKDTRMFTDRKHRLGWKKRIKNQNITKTFSLIYTRSHVIRDHLFCSLPRLRHIFYILLWVQRTKQGLLIISKTSRQNEAVWVQCVWTHHASPRRWPTACGCWVCASGGCHRLVWKQPAPHRHSAAPGTECTEHTHTHSVLLHTHALSECESHTQTRWSHPGPELLI